MKTQERPSGPANVDLAFESHYGELRWGNSDWNAALMRSVAERLNLQEPGRTRTKQRSRRDAAGRQ